jgi:selenocysteine insertion sequence-binding protein 2
VTYVGPNAAVQDYCIQEISPALNSVVVGLLSSIKGFQDRAMAKNPVKANMRRWYVCGLREVRKAIKAGKAKAVLLAPNIEQIEAEGGLNDSVEDIIAVCKEVEPAIPVVFALSRKKMGEVYGFRKRMSAIALLELGGVQEQFDQMLQLAEEGRQRFAARQAAAPAGL